MYYYNSFIYDSIYKNGLRSIEPIRKREKKNILEFSEPSEIYNCLSWFSDEELQSDYIFINNPDYKSHIVLMRYRVSFMFVGYDDGGWFSTIIPFDCAKGNRNNHQIFAYRYMLFARYQALEENMYPEPKLTFQRWGRKI